MKRCTICHRSKRLALFGPDKYAPDGINYRCRSCNRKKGLVWKRNHPEEAGRTELARKYGITPQQRRDLLAKQENRCAICRAQFKSPKDTHTDHVHDSKPPRVRGILCFSCNLGLGHFHDCEVVLQAAAEYIHQHR